MVCLTGDPAVTASEQALKEEVHGRGAADAPGGGICSTSSGSADHLPNSSLIRAETARN